MPLGKGNQRESCKATIVLLLALTATGHNVYTNFYEGKTFKNVYEVGETEQISQSLAYQVNQVNLLIELPCESHIGNTYKMGMQAIYKKGIADLWREKG